MLDIAWPELLLIGAVALVAIGPKDLPKAMFTLGKWAGKARRFAHDIHRTFEQVAYEAEQAEKMKAQKSSESGSSSEAQASSSKGSAASPTAAPEGPESSKTAESNADAPPIMKPFEQTHE